MLFCITWYVSSLSRARECHSSTCRQAATERDFAVAAADTAAEEHSGELAREREATLDARDRLAAAAASNARLEAETKRLRELCRGQAGCLAEAAARRGKEADAAAGARARLEAVMAEQRCRIELAERKLAAAEEENGRAARGREEDARALEEARRDVDDARAAAESAERRLEAVSAAAQRKHAEAEAAAKEASEREAEKQVAESAAAAAADGEERARRKLESVEATLAAEAEAHREELVSLQRQTQAERKGREEALVKLEETRAHVRSMQGEAAQSRRREAMQARQREVEAEARAGLEHALDVAKAEAAAVGPRLALPSSLSQSSSTLLSSVSMHALLHHLDMNFPCIFGLHHSTQNQSCCDTTHTW